MEMAAGGAGVLASLSTIEYIRTRFRKQKWSSGRLARDSFHVLMEGAPAHLDVAAIQETLSEVPGVVKVHDLHVWTITSGFVSLSAHLKISGGQNVQGIIRQAHLVVSSRFNVFHSTFQPEIAEDPGCETASCPETPPERPS
jgi:divalent metal cation (Fe/Co/Zn/Cd) transporter